MVIGTVEGLVNMMKVSEIIVHAACNSAVVPSFNREDIPGDIYAIGLHKLKHEVLPLMNVDRTLDMAQQTMVLQPKDNRILLKRDPLEIVTNGMVINDGYLLDGDSKWVWEGQHLLKPSYSFNITKVPFRSNLLPQNTEKWFNVDFIPRDSRVLNNNLKLGYKRFEAGFRFAWDNIDKPILCIETSDHKLFMVIHMQTPYNDYSGSLVRSVDTNMRTMPYFIDTVLDEPSGLPYTYLDQSQFWSIDYKFMPWIYTQRNGDDWLELEFKNTGNILKRITIPIPIYINGDDMIAPPKFFQYLVDTLAEQYAVHYGMSTLPIIQQQRATSYGVLKRQNPRIMQPMNVRQQIRSVFQSGQSRWWRFDGFN